MKRPPRRSCPHAHGARRRHQGATFSEGHEPDEAAAALLPPSAIGRMLDQEEAAKPLDPVVVGALVPAATAFGRRSWSGRRLRRGLCCIRRPFRLFARAVTPAVVAVVLIHPTFISAPEHLLAFGGGL